MPSSFLWTSFSLFSVEHCSCTKNHMAALPRRAPRRKERKPMRGSVAEDDYEEIVLSPKILYSYERAAFRYAHHSQSSELLGIFFPRKHLYALMIACSTQLSSPLCTMISSSK